MKNLGLDEKTISGFWKAEGRVHLEAASVVWGSGMKKEAKSKRNGGNQCAEHAVISNQHYLI